MRGFALVYIGHRPGADLGYFTGASVTLVSGDRFEIPPHGLVLGRRASADLRVASSMVAPKHARVTPREDGVLVEDLASTNHTLLNGERIARAVAKAGDRVTLAGSFDFDVIESTR
jgi:pSer/pThr/pTyr-binding forkhead associated (FHA) protein